MSIFKQLYRIEADTNNNKDKQIEILLKKVSELKENLSVSSDLNEKLHQDKKELQNLVKLYGCEVLIRLF